MMDDGNLFAYGIWMADQEARTLCRDRVELELERRKEQASSKLAKFVSPALLNEFTLLLTEAHATDLDSADNIMKIMNISQDDLRALNDDDYDIERQLNEEALYRNEADAELYQDEYMYG